MAKIIGPILPRHKSHRVILRDIFWMKFDKIYAKSVFTSLESHQWFRPFTCPQSVGIVASYSYMVIVNPEVDVLM